MAQTGVKSVAKQVFRDFKTSQVVDSNFNTTNAISRAIKIFMFSFGGYEQICPQLYQQKFAEYMNAMQRLYGVPSVDQSLIENQIKILNSQKIKITIGIKKFTGRALVTKPEVTVIHGSNKSSPIPLSTDQIVQNNAYYCQNITFNDLKQNRQQRTGISLILGGRDWKMGRGPLNPFAITYNQISAEGFEDWFYFGRGVRLLIKINFNIEEMGDIYDKKFVSKFHLHSIIYMIRERLQNYSNRRDQSNHRPITRKYKISLIRRRVDPKTDQSFWSLPYTMKDVLQTIQSSVVDTNEDYSRIKALMRNDIKFNDMQIGYQFMDEFEGSDCLCNEWCNWNAFFHYNPIYRFLLVQNNYLFLENRTNVPEMYLFGSIFCGYEVGVSLPTNQALPKTPVLGLIFSADRERNRLYQTLYATNTHRFKTDYNSGYPDPKFLNGLSYNLIRYELRIADLLLQSDPNPLSDNCIENICEFNKMFSQLHIWCSTRSSLIKKDPKDHKLWFKELELVVRQKYRIYLKLSFDRRIANPITTYDYFFTEDYQYSNQLQDKSIKLIRDCVIKLGFNDNPLNIRVILNDFLSTFVSFYKFIGMVEPTLPLATTVDSRIEIYQYFKTFDIDFTAFSQNLDFDFRFDEQLFGDLSAIREELTVLFTLRLYSMSSGIQSECIKSVMDWKQKVKYRAEQVFNHFNFIWSNRLIEQKLRNDFPNITLFELNANIEQTFIDFYENYWGRADHEINNYPVQRMQPIISSGYFQYQRLYYWWTHNGNNRIKFRSFINSLSIAFEDIVRHSERIYINYIMPSIRDLSREHHFYLEVMDVLVYYLVRADCYMILSSIAVFLKKVFSLILDTLVPLKVCYSLSKPGWVPIFRTMTTCLQFLDQIKTQYIVFDDEMDRLSNIFSQTKQFIKDMYRDFYRKQCNDWLQEINKLGGLKNVYTNSRGFISLHLAVGVSFLAAFVDNFRRQTEFYRKFLNTLLDYQSAHPHQQKLNTHVNIVQEFLRNPIEIQTALPLLWDEWQQDMPSIDFNDWDQLTEQVLGIDLNAANK